MDEEKRELPVAVTVNVNGVGAYPPPPAPTVSHEELDDLNGGDDDGHYHLTEDEYNYVTAIVDERRELDESGEQRYTLNEEEYSKLVSVIDKIYPSEDEETYVLNEEEYNKLIGVIEKMYPSEDEESYTLSEEEYNKTITLLDTIYPNEDSDPVFPGLTEAEVDTKIAAIEPGVTETVVDAKIAAIDHERLTNLQGSSADEHYHVTSDEAEKLQKLIAAFFPDGATEPVIPSGGEVNYASLRGQLATDGTFAEMLYMTMKQNKLIA